MRRSHSATSIRLSDNFLLSPLRLPNLAANDQDGKSWSVALNESLRLSQEPVYPDSTALEKSQATLKTQAMLGNSASKPEQYKDEPSLDQDRSEKKPIVMPSVVGLCVPQPTVLASPRQSDSLRLDTHCNPPVTAQEAMLEEDCDDNEQRRSIHLYSMRISHHLRSGSLLSWDTLANGSKLPSPSSAFRDRSFSDVSGKSKYQRQPSRHERKTSSSGFASSQVPSKWGKVVEGGIHEDKSSIYSSRPQSSLDSPLKSYGGSMVNLSRTPRHTFSIARSSSENDRLRRSNSFPTDNDETPKPVRKHGLTNLRDVTSHSALTRRSDDGSGLARYNSVASTKMSKFREELSLSPAKKRLIPSTSILKFFNPRRDSDRSQSETSLKIDSTAPVVDGSLEPPGPTTQCERRQSKSMISLEAEQRALKTKNADPMWERALQNYQDEKAAMFLPKNKDQAPYAGPFRERSGSVAPPRTSDESEVIRKLSVPKRFSAPMLDPLSPNIGEFGKSVSTLTRRTALSGTVSSTADPDQEAQLRFAQQTDTVETVGAWGRYPSHTRSDRTLSAGHSDQVQTRDFALEAAIKFAMGKNINDNDEQDIDPATRPLTPPLLPGQKKRKRKTGDARMAKSHSMSFGKSLLKNYVKIFRSQSIEFHKHGSGHRSSIATGGMLEYPELEILPDVWRRGIIEEPSRDSNSDNPEPTGPPEEHPHGDAKGKGKMKEEESAATLRALPAGSSRPTTSNLLQAGLDGTRDTARVWSTYYENCLPSFPRASTELDFTMEDFRAPSRRSLESRRASVRSRSIPVRRNKHSRNTSRMSHLSRWDHALMWEMR